MKNHCGNSIACTTASSGGGADYPHLQSQRLWVEFPPQFDATAKQLGDMVPKQWTDRFSVADRYSQFYYYLQHIMMHELAHIAGLGHAYYGNVMGGVRPGSDYVPIEELTDYDLDGMKHIYQNHAKH